MIKEIMEDARIYSDEEIKEQALEMIGQFAKDELSYYEAHKALEAHIAVFKEAFVLLGHNALYELDKQPITFKLN